MPDEEFRKAPFLRILFPLVGGIVLGRNMPDPLPWICLGASVVFWLVVFFSQRPGMVPILLVFLCIGMVLGREPGVPRIPEGMIAARVCDEVHPAGNAGKTLIDRIRYHEQGRWKRVEGKAFAYLKNGEAEMDMCPGTYILARGKLAAYKPPMNPAQFDYGAFQRGRGIFYHIYLDAGSWIRIEPGGLPRTGIKPEAQRGLRIRSLIVRRALIEKLESRIKGEDQRAILNSLLLGYRKELDPAVKQNFARSGTLHILAVSGLHVGILYLLPALLLKRLRPYAAAGIIGSILVFTGLWMYAFLTGLSPSVVRAVCMCSIHRLAVMSGRKVSSLHVVSLAAFIMIMYRPALVFEAGFQLSFAAVTGIICMYRRFLACFPFSGWFGRRISQMVSVSLSAQLATMPLSVFYFHQFSTASVPANLFVIPLVTAILYVGLCFFLFTGLDIITGSAASLLHWMSSFLEWFTRTLSGFPGACMDGLSLVPLQVIVLFATGVLALLYLRSRNTRALFLLLSGVILFLALTCIREYRILSHHGVYVFSLPGETAIGLVRGRQSVLFRGIDPGEDSGRLPYELVSFFSRYKLDTPLSFSGNDSGSGDAAFPWYRHIDSPGMDAIYIVFKQRRMLVLSGWKEEYCVGLPRLDADILVLCNNPRVNIPSLVSHFNVSQVIVDGSNYPAYQGKIETACREAGIRFHSTGVRGYFYY